MEQVVNIVKKAIPIVIFILILMIIVSIFISLSSSKPLTFFGYKPLTVLSNSMVPTFEAGDVIITKEIDAEDLKAGDIITFYNKENNLITHRITSIVGTGGEEHFYTQGDNNNTMDEDMTTANKIVGKELFHIPNLGFLSQYTKGPMGFLLFIIIPLAGYVCLTVYEKTKQQKKQEEFTKSKN
ncbi:signal peptidase I [Bacillus haikouensis]|uniref:signal peptidase I n=1 Tax=Bacillus haikouensis TaxID=1510468 RepID=UPI001553FFD7|nr:signal peptidase I [Bacillus haikouensis]NQD67238.1 signal peptidase I [Bacillus haikouensis]